MARPRVTGTRALTLLLALVAAAGCRATRSEPSTFEALGDPYADPEAVYRFGEGGRYEYAENGRTVLTIEVRDGRLYCNDRDTGPYVPRSPVRILSRSDLIVDGERRPIPERQGPARLASD